MREEYFVRENGEFEPVLKESAEGLGLSGRQVFKFTELGFEKKHYLGIKAVDYFDRKYLKWKEVSPDLLQTNQE